MAAEKPEACSESTGEQWTHAGCVQKGVQRAADQGAALPWQGLFRREIDGVSARVRGRKPEGTRRKKQEGFS